MKKKQISLKGTARLKTRIEDYFDARNTIPKSWEKTVDHPTENLCEILYQK